MTQLGLKRYEHLGSRELLPPIRRIDLQEDELGKLLEPIFTTGFEYSDCRIDDSRLVVANAVKAQKCGAAVFTRTTRSQVKAVDEGWKIDLKRKAGKLESCVCERADTAADLVSAIECTIVDFRLCNVSPKANADHYQS